MSQADDVIAAEKAEVGYLEGFSNGHYNNHQKFSPAVPGLEWSQNQAWCQTFQSWGFQEAELKPLAPVTASCATAVAWYRRRGRFSYYPAVGAMVFFGSGGGGHVGLVYKYDADYAYTIEGNTNSSGSAEGNGVYLKKRPRRDNFLYGYGLPAFTEGIVTADPGLRGRPGYTYKTAASSGAPAPGPTPPVTDTEPSAEEALPWVSSNQLVWAAGHTGAEEQAAEPGDSNPADDVALVQRALEQVMGVATGDESGLFEGGTQQLYDRFRQEKLGYTGADATGAPGSRSLVELGARSRLFRVRAGSTPALNLPWVSLNQVRWAATHTLEEQHAQPAGAASARADVTFVQQGLSRVLFTSVSDEAGIFGTATQMLYDDFRQTVLHFLGDDAVGAPGAESLTELGHRSGLFRVRADAANGSTGGGTGGAAGAAGRIDPKDVEFDRSTADGTLEEWIREACGAAGVPATNHWIRGYKTAAPRESSGNPNACNLWDSNAVTPSGFSRVHDFGDGYRRNRPVARINGALTPFQCSRGVVQCIPQTFARYHAPGTSVCIYDPVASIAASIRYVRNRYRVAADGSNLASKVQQFDPNRPPHGY